jgi:hypothetical protein
VGTYSDIRDQRYQTELDIGTSDIGLKRAESDIILDIGINFYPISDIQYPNIHTLAQWLRSKAFAFENKCLGFKSCRFDKYFLDIRYRNELRCRYWNPSDIGMTVFSPTYFLPISD